MDYEGYIKFADDSVVSVQCFEGRHGECADIENHVEDGPVTAPQLDGYYCECDCPPARPARARGPMPAVTYDGEVFKVRSRKTVIPDLDAMDRMGALVWLNQNTFARGTGIRTKPNPLAGMGGAIRLTVR